MGRKENLKEADARWVCPKWWLKLFYTAFHSVIAGKNEHFSSSQHILEALAFFLPKAFFTFSEIYPTTGHVQENVKKFCKTQNWFASLSYWTYSFATAFKLYNFDIVENKNDHADYGHVSDEFSGSTEDTDDEYGVDLQWTIKSSLIACQFSLTQDFFWFDFFNFFLWYGWPKGV